MQSSIPQSTRPPFWRDERILSVLTQVFVVGTVLLLLWYLYSNMASALRAQLGVPFTFGWIDSTASFDITPSFGLEALDYTRSSTYGEAILVGLINTLIVAVLGIVLATLTGIFVGVARLSTNWLVSKLAAIFIDLFRNIPLLLLLIFWSQAIFQQLPRVQEAIILPGSIYISNKGFAIPWGTPTDSWGVFLGVLGLGLAAAIGVGVALTMQGRRTGRMPLVSLWAPLTFVGIALAGALVLWSTGAQPLTFTRPELDGFNTTGGRILQPELLALISALALYTGAFIAEVVRAGIQSVAKGQREAATALGLSNFQTLRLVVFPQALRVMIPPMTSQYLNLTKNSSLAIAIGYPDLFAVSGNTVRNQTGRAVEVFLIIMAVYLSFSLLTSLFMNWYNSRIKLVER